MIIFGWSELPNYAVDCIKSLSQKSKILVLTDNKNAKNLLPSVDVKIIKLNKKYSWSEVGCCEPKFFFFTGWNNIAFNHLANTKLAKNICLIDNIYKGTLRQFFGKYYFKFYLRNLFDAIIVPGFKSQKFVEYLGYDKKIYKGLYTCNQKIFKDKKNKIRKYDFIYVGKFIARKNLKLLLAVFHKIQKIYSNTKLNMVGGYKKIMNNEKIFYRGTLDSKEISNQLNNSKCLILPSIEEHWGVAVHEAISCGCALILSNKVGSSIEYLKSNGYDFNAKSPKELFIAMKKIINKNHNELELMKQQSLKLSKKHSILKWKKTINQIMHNLEK